MPLGLVVLSFRTYKSQDEVVVKVYDRIIQRGLYGTHMSLSRVS